MANINNAFNSGTNNNSPPGPFQPYDTTLNPDDSIMRRVPFASMDIGANAASMPMGLNLAPGQIDHVGAMPTRASRKS